MEVAFIVILAVLFVVVAVLIGYALNLRKRLNHALELIDDLKDNLGSQEPANDWRKSVL